MSRFSVKTPSSYVAETASISTRMFQRQTYVNGMLTST